MKNSKAIEVGMGRTKLRHRLKRSIKTGNPQGKNTIKGWIEKIYPKMRYLSIWSHHLSQAKRKKEKKGQWIER